MNIEKQRYTLFHCIVLIELSINIVIVFHKIRLIGMFVGSQGKLTRTAGVGN